LPFHFSASESNAATHAPLLGEHTELVLRNLGIQDDRLTRLKQEGVVVQADNVR
jgi:crotonobetainyl-CoA:carnitine CoA-transferase CaiB-like acyl-CoA transferase